MTKEWHGKTPIYIVEIFLLGWNFVYRTSLLNKLFSMTKLLGTKTNQRKSVSPHGIEGKKHLPNYVQKHC